MNKITENIQKCKKYIEDNNLKNFCLTIPNNSAFDDPYQGIKIANKEQLSYITIEEFILKFNI